MKAVILAGGGGTRLWPLSTNQKPKQFQKLVSEKTMLEETVERLDFLKPEDIYLAINEEHIELAYQLCPQIPEENFILEPDLRDTASCIGYSAAIIENRHPGEVMAVIYADHLIKNKKEFQENLKLAEEVAQKENTLNIVEVSAEEPNTNYGYVKLGPKVGSSIYKLDCFKEKPNLETAKKFLAEGNYLWNTGIYVWKTDLLLEHYRKIQPETYKKLMAMVETGSSELYPTLEKISIDYAIMEKVDTEDVRIIKAENLGWSDIGNWQAIHEELAKSPEENIERGEVKSLDCEGCLIYGDAHKPIKAIGLKDIIIVDTPEGLLISKKSDSKKVKEL